MLVTLLTSCGRYGGRSGITLSKLCKNLGHAWKTVICYLVKKKRHKASQLEPLVIACIACYCHD